MLMVADAGEGGVKNHPKSADVVYGLPLRHYGKEKILILLLTFYLLLNQVDYQDLVASPLTLFR